MTALKPLASSGKGKIAAILPDTTSSTRYQEFDTPYLKKAAVAAGLSASDITVQNGNGSDSTFLSDAQSDITNGASILLIDPEDAGTGAKVAQYARLTEPRSSTTTVSPPASTTCRSTTTPSAA